MTSGHAGDCPCATPPQPQDALFGVLLVHGMGEQQRGDTLLLFGEPMIKWMRRAIAQTDGQATGSPPAAPPTANVSAGERRLQGQSLKAEPRILDSEVLRVHGDESDTPAHLRLAWSKAEPTAGVMPMLMAESWWASDFRPASFLDVVKWGVRIAPFVLNDTRRHQTKKLNIFLWNGQLPLTLLLGPVIHLVLLLLLVLSYLPFLGGAASNGIRRLANSFGDPYLLLWSPVRFSSMVERIHHDIRWLKDQGCTKIAIVAHSQGASVSHRALKTLPTDSGVTVSHFITFGAAIRKLYTLGHVDYGGKWRLRGGIANTVIVLVMLGTLLFGCRVIPDSRWANLIIPFVWLGGSVVYWIIASLASKNPIDETALRDAILITEEPGPTPGSPTMGVPPTAWLDLYARADPVSLTNLPLDTPQTGYESREIRNRDSVPTDHTYYWRNPEQFVGTVCRRLMVDADWPVNGEPVLDSGGMDGRFTRRGERVDGLNWAFRISAVSCIVAVLATWSFGASDEVSAPIMDGAEIAARELTIPFEGFIKDTIGDGRFAEPSYALLLLLAVTMIWYSGFVMAAWERWNTIQTGESFTPGETPGAKGSEFFYPMIALTPVVLLGVILALALG